MTRIRFMKLRNRILWEAVLVLSCLVVLTSPFTPTSTNRIRRKAVLKLPVSSTSDQTATTTATTQPTSLNVADENRNRKNKEDVSGNARRQQQRRKPWRASFHVSKKTQQKIQRAAIDANGRAKRSNGQRATAVLNALLNTQPEKCNAANLVCALTLSAKVLGSHGHSNDNFRSLLFEALGVLDDLVEQKRLHSRQLCNAIWAVAKHYDRDPLLLPATQELISERQSGVPETWDLAEEDDNGVDDELTPAQRLDNTVDAIASQLTAMLNDEVSENKTDDVNGGNMQAKPGQGGASRKTKLGELCMASWAFGVLRPRQRPPGWLQPPQIGRLSQSNQLDEPQTKRSNDFMSFQQWTMDDDDLSFLKLPGAHEDVSNSNLEPIDAVDGLFDAIGEALCRPIHGEEHFSSSMYEPQFDEMRLTGCSWSEIANLAWAFEKRGRCLSAESETLLRALTREAAWRLRTGGSETRHMLSRDISQLIWALGTLQQDNFRLAHDLVALVEHFSDYLGMEGRGDYDRPFQKWSCPDIVQMILSLSHARIDDSRLLLALFKEANVRLDKGIYSDSRQPQQGRKVFLAWEVCVMLWAQARLHLTSSEGRIYEEFPKSAISCINSAAIKGGLVGIGIGPQEQANLAWALTVLQHHQSDDAVELLRGVFHHAANACKEEGFIQLEHAHQLWQALFLLEEESPPSVSTVPKWFRDYLSDKWNLEKSMKKISSARHKSISDVLNLMGIAHYNEHDEDIDVAIVLKSQASWAHQTQTECAESSVDNLRVAVEFDGPNHFTRKRIPRDNPSSAQSVRALGHTILKYRLLKLKGWTCVRIPYYEFDQIPFWASMERQRYLQRKLKTHANIKFSSLDVSEYSAMAPNRKTRFD